MVSVTATGTSALIPQLANRWQITIAFGSQIWCGASRSYKTMMPDDLKLSRKFSSMSGFRAAVVSMFAVTMTGCFVFQDGAMIRARSAMDKGKYQSALNRLAESESYKAPSPERKAEITYLKGLCYEGMGKAQDAQAMFKYVAVNFPVSTQAYQARQKLGEVAGEPTSSRAATNSGSNAISPAGQQEGASSSNAHAAGGQGRVSQARTTQVIQNWQALRTGMTLEQVDKLIGPLSKMAMNGVVHFDMAGKADYVSAYYTDTTCELVFKCKVRERKSAVKTLETTDSRLVSWKRK